MNQSDHFQRLLILFFLVFFELFAYCLVVPSFYPIFLDEKAQLLTAYTSPAAKKHYYALLMMCYPLAQILGAPLVGSLSDRIGRKKTLNLTLMGNVLGYSLSALALYFHQPLLIFLGFCLSGLTGGNIPISQSAIADISTKREKAKNMSLVLASYGFCYILGSLIGGKLTSGAGSYTLPFILAACISFINLLFATVFFKETYLPCKQAIDRREAPSFKSLLEPLKKPHNLKLITVVFLSFFGWNFFIKILQVFLNDRYGFLSEDNAYVLAILGLWTLFTQAFLLPLLNHLYTTADFLKVSTLGLGLSLVLLPFSANLTFFYLIFSIASISYSFLLPCLTAALSNVNTKEAQGKVIGISQAIQSLAKTLSPLPAAFLSALNPSLPLFTSGCLLLITFTLLTFIFKIRNVELVAKSS